MSDTHPHIEPRSLQNLGDVAVAWGARSGEIAVIETGRDGERHISFAQFAGLAGAFGRDVEDRGLEPGSRVGILGNNSVEYLAAYFGIMQAGFTVVPLNKKLPDDALAAIATDATMAFAFVDRDMRDRLPEALARAFLDVVGAPDPSKARAPAAAAPPWDAELLYTSGSSGAPKGVELPHGGQIWALAALYRNLTPGHHTHIVAQPLYHMNGIVVSSLALLSGGTIVLQPEFDTSAYVAAIARYRVDSVSAIPTMWARALALHETGGADLSSVTTLSLGSAPVTTQLLARTRAALPDVMISISYGTTEAGPAVFGPHPDGKPRPGVALGHPVPGIDIRLADGTSEDEGVLEMRTPAMMRGYRGQPERTADVLHDGWYRSGDVMRRDRDGFYTFIGRADDMFVCSGENIYPGEVERVLESHPAVRQAVVVPLPDDERGQMPVAFVVAAAGAALSSSELKSYALAHAAPHLHPRRVALRDELPLAGTNKIDRTALRVEAVRLETEGWWD